MTEKERPRRLLEFKGCHPAFTDYGYGYSFLQSQMEFNQASIQPLNG